MTPLVLADGDATARRVAVELGMQGWSVHQGCRPPDDGWRLEQSKTVCRCEVRDDQDARELVAAAARGAGVLAIVDLGSPLAALLFDDLSRLGPVRVLSGAEDALDDDQRRMLALLANGATLPEVARALHFSLRTVNRRLAAARAALGARTTAEAAAACCRGQGAGTAPLARRPASEPAECG